MRGLPNMPRAEEETDGPAAAAAAAPPNVEADTQLEQGVRPFPLGNPGHYTYYQVCR